MAATPGDVPTWLQDDNSEIDGGEDISLDARVASRQFHDLTGPSSRRSRCVRCAIPLVICLSLSALAAGLAVYFSGKNPSSLANDAYQAMGGNDKEPYSDEPTEFSFFSPEFEDGDSYPSKYTSAGDGMSPPIQWKNVPDGTESLILLFDEPSDDSAGVDGQPALPSTFWVAYDIPIMADGIPEGVPNAERIELTRADTDEGNGGNDIFMLQGVNTWGAQAMVGGDDGVGDDAAVGTFGYRPPDADDGDDRVGEVRIFYFRLLAIKEKLAGSLDPKFATAEEVRKQAKEVGLLAELSLQVSYQE